MPEKFKAGKFEVDPWRFEISGLCNNPVTLDLNDLFKIEHEYGSLSNVNPNIPHPRWSQENSYWLDTRESFKTPVFNGYDKYVGQLYPDEPRTPQIPLHEGQIAR